MKLTAPLKHPIYSDGKLANIKMGQMRNDWTIKQKIGYEDNWFQMIFYVKTDFRLNYSLNDLICLNQNC